MGCNQSNNSNTISIKNENENESDGTKNNSVVPYQQLRKKKKKIIDRRTQKILNQLKQINIIELLNENQRIEVAKRLKRVKYNPGDILMKQDEIGKEFFLIVDGLCDVFVSNIKVSQLRSGDYAGEQALILNNSKRTATVKAINETKALVMSKEIFDTIVRSNNIKFITRRGQQAFYEEDFDDDDESDSDLDYINDNYHQIEWILDCVKNNLLFKNLQESVIKKIISKMKLINVKKGSEIISQNDIGKLFYVIESGTFQVEKNNQVVDTISRGQSVGELSLLYNSKRNATVRSISSNCTVWVMKRKTYKTYVRQAAKELDYKKIEFLRKIPLLKHLNSSEISLFARSLTLETYNSGHVICRQGEIGSKFYIIYKGQVTGYEKREDGTVKDFQLSEGEYFGEVALMSISKLRSATVSTATNCTLLCATKEDFNLLFGPIESILEKNFEEYEKPVQSDKEYRLSLAKRNLNDFENGPIIGRGKYGLVRFVKDKNNSKIYALKAIKKVWVTSKRVKQTKRRIKALMNERDVMKLFSRETSCQFLIKLRGTFKDNVNVYFLMEAATGGDFFNILKTKGYVDEKCARYHIACLIEAIDALHKLNLIHRDLKPENIVIHEKGYSMLTDFGFTKKLDNNNKTYTLCGTPGYMAPEVLLGHGYGKGADWFSIGCVLYDMLTGAPPFNSSDPLSMIKEITNNKLHLPMYLSFWVKDLICQLLKSNPVKRLGVIHGGTDRIRKHQWFNGFDWNSLRNGNLKPPFYPKITNDLTNNFDTSNIEEMTREIERHQKVFQLPIQFKNWELDF